MNNRIFYVLPAVALCACGGEETSTDDAPKADSAAVEIQYAPLMATAEVSAQTVYKNLAEFTAVEDKSTVVRYVSEEYNKPFPTELLDAQNLQVLALTNMTGDIPAEINKFKNLTTLVISGDFATLPESLGELVNIKTVSLDYCKKLDINQAIGVLKNCPNLQYLSLSAMDIAELPASVSDLKALVEIRLGDNLYTTLPDALFGLPNLKDLYLSGPGLDYEAVLIQAKALPALVTLHLQYAGLTTLPKGLSEYPALTTVHWREQWEGKDSEQIIATTEKETKKFGGKIYVTWDSMGGMYYDIY